MKFRVGAGFIIALEIHRLGGDKPRPCTRRNAAAGLFIWSSINYDKINPRQLNYTYRGCQKNVPLLERFFLQPLRPHFLISE
jgi:hypothetical protein